MLAIPQHHKDLFRTRQAALLDHILGDDLGTHLGPGVEGQRLEIRWDRVLLDRGTGPGVFLVQQQV